MYEYEELIRSSNRCERIASGHFYLHIVIEGPDPCGLSPVAVFFLHRYKKKSVQMTVFFVTSEFTRQFFVNNYLLVSLFGYENLF